MLTISRRDRGESMDVARLRAIAATWADRAEVMGETFADVAGRAAVRIDARAEDMRFIQYAFPIDREIEVWATYVLSEAELQSMQTRLANFEGDSDRFRRVLSSDRLTREGHLPLYPIVIPPGWTLIGSEGTAHPIDAPAGATAVRLKVAGAVIAANVDPSSPDRGERVEVDELAFDRSLDGHLLAEYARETAQGDRISEQVMLDQAFGMRPAARVVVERGTGDSSRVEVVYLVTDELRRTLTVRYDVRGANRSAWFERLEEITR